jgi:4'-phosphopantetheinyl transferase EntD
MLEMRGKKIELIHLWADHVASETQLCKHITFSAKEIVFKAFSVTGQHIAKKPAKIAILKMSGSIRPSFWHCPLNLYLNRSIHLQLQIHFLMI